jgi:hypothetical protein
MKKFQRGVVLTVMAAMLLLGAAAPTLQAQKGDAKDEIGFAGKPKGALALPIAGAGVANATFNGTLNLTGFGIVNNVPVAFATLVGTLTNGGVTQTIVKLLTIPLANMNANCDILHLELGPLDLNLLGVMIHLNKIVLDIDAQAGPGNLLGNLLCDIAHALDGNNLNALQKHLDKLLGNLIGL